MLVLCDLPQHVHVDAKPRIVWEDSFLAQSKPAAALDGQLLFASLSVGMPTLTDVITKERSPEHQPSLGLGGADEPLFSEPTFEVQGSFAAKISMALLPDLELGF